MLNVLPTDYLSHHILLVQAMLSSSIDRQSIHQAQRLIQHYCFKFADYYELNNMTANVHCLLHLPEVVKEQGPLYATSCFSFEASYLI